MRTTACCALACLVLAAHPAAAADVPASVRNAAKCAPSATSDPEPADIRHVAASSSVSTLSPSVLGIAFAEEGARPFEHVVAREDPVRCIHLGSEAHLEIDIPRRVDETLCFAHRERAA